MTEPSFVGTPKQMQLALDARRALRPALQARIDRLVDERACRLEQAATRPNNAAIAEAIVVLDDELAYLRDALYCRDAKWWIDHRHRADIKDFSRTQTARERDLCLGTTKPRGSFEAMAVAIGCLWIAGALDESLRSITSSVTDGDREALLVLLDLAEARGLGR